MDLLLIIGLIVWITNSAKKRRDAQLKQDAARARARAAALAQAEAQASAAASMQQAARPTVQPQKSTEPSAPRMTTPQQRRHPLMPSRKTGHAHMETSMTGIEADCPPISASANPSEIPPLADRLSAYKAEKRRAEQAKAPVSKAPEVVDLAETKHASFSFDPARVREGLIYAEILGKPKALRR